MSKKTDNLETNQETTTRVRASRKKTYERVRESALDKELINYFNKEGWDLKLIRWAINGDEDYRYLNRREREGYEFVTSDEIPDKFKAGMNIIDTKNRKGLITMGDLVLMKVDSDLRNSRRKVYQQITDNEVASVDVNVLEKKHGLKNTGSRTKVYVGKEPGFAD